jgi:uncharacterized protein
MRLFSFASVARAAALALALVLVPAAALAAPAFPPLTGRVVDQANILPADVEAELDAKLAALEAKTTDQVVVVTLPSLGDYDIADYGYQLGRHWQIGQKGLNNGVMFIIAPNERKVRFEVGYGLEPVLTDALSSVILQTEVLPRFRENDYAGGVRAGVDALVTQLSMPREDAIARAKAAVKPKAKVNPVAMLFIGFIVFFVLMSFLGALGRGRRRHGGDGLLPILIWSALSSSGRGGGGWGGGGGSFGGGGASGGW